MPSGAGAACYLPLYTAAKRRSEATGEGSYEQQTDHHTGHNGRIVDMTFIEIDGAKTTLAVVGGTIVTLPLAAIAALVGVMRYQ